MEPTATPDAPQALTAARILRDEGLFQSHWDAQSIDRCQGKDRNRNRRAGHIDGRAQRNGYGVSVPIQSQVIIQRHVHRNVRSGILCEESCDATFPQASEDERKLDWNGYS